MVEMYKLMYESIKKLSSDNYDSWKLSISTILSAMLALKIVTGEEVEDDLPVGNCPANIAKRKSNEKQQALATTMAILLSCTPEVRIYLSGINRCESNVGYTHGATKQLILIWPTSHNSQKFLQCLSKGQREYHSISLMYE